MKGWLTKLPSSTMIIVLFVPLATALASVVSGGSIFSPGALQDIRRNKPLNGAYSHNDLACGDCHAPYWSADAMADRCLDCHGAIGNEIDQGAELHGTLPAATECRACHTEHNGPEANLTVMDPNIFPHQEVGFSLAAHLPPKVDAALACNDCHLASYHETANAQCDSCHASLETPKYAEHLLTFGMDCVACHDGVDHYGADFDHQATDFPLLDKHGEADCADCHGNAHSQEALLAAPTDCIGCHGDQDPHEGRLGIDCAACHDARGWQVETFDHRLTGFPLAASHADVACNDCHVEDVTVPIAAECISCHEADDIHQGQLGPDCAKCHTSTDWNDIIPEDFDHSLSRFPLIGAHQSVACVDCHQGGEFRGTPTQCISCHRSDDVHKGELGTNCSSCHTSSAWDQTTFDHKNTSFPLTGRHAGTACTACHQSAVFSGTPQACVACHRQDDAHNGAFGDNCAACHNTSSWGGASFDHASVGFALTGRHTTAQCADCHIAGRFAGTPKNCVSCHQSDDAHNGAFGPNCADCHNTSGWGGGNFDHASTGFALTGRHASAQCTDCHQNGHYAGTPSSCVSCHQQDDAHNGANGTNCAACHNTSGWGGGSFDHAAAGFPLTGRHATAQCTDCHQNGQYAGTSANCSSCHSGDKPSNHYAGECSACHGSTSSWSSNINFSHVGRTDCQSCHNSDKPSNHYAGQCSACHGSTSSWSSNINFSHAGQTDCQSCHNSDKPSNHFAGQCSACHGSTSSWSSNINFSHAGQTDCQSCHNSDKPSNHYAGQCSNCHSTSGWGGANFDHASTGFPLTGRHTSAQCTDCHQNGQYAGTPSSCVSCHSEPSYHAGILGTNCASCHTTSGWRPANYSGSHTFPMGHHGANSNCRTCHTTSLASYTCYECHNQQETEQHHEGISNLTNCVACHPTGRND
ncbi:MAG: hypothetical protein WBR18_06150 [Anaerolineales bacterium]